MFLWNRGVLECWEESMKDISVSFDHFSIIPFFQSFQIVAGPYLQKGKDLV